MNLDKRASILLKTLIERYNIEGQPIGSKTLSKYSGLDLSPASIRNVMAELEERGYIASPHTSAGRVPTPLGYRLFIDQLLTTQELDDASLESLKGKFKERPSISQQDLIAEASSLLSGLTRFAGIVAIPQTIERMVRHVEFVYLSANRVLVILVTTDGSVQNRIFTISEEIVQDQLDRAADYFNSHYSGLDLTTMQQKLDLEIAALRGDIAALMQTMLKLNAANAPEAFVLSGQKNLLNLSDFSQDIAHMRELFDFFEQKAALIKILDAAKAGQGVQIFIGGESDIGLLEGASMVTANYEVEGQVVGALGVLGPMRMAYEKVIPIVDITARLLSSALSPYQ
jgi:heat-inducible transcriptional repressor